MWMAALKFECSEMLRQKVWMAKRRDQEFFFNFDVSKCASMGFGVCYVCVMWYVYVHNVVCMCA